MSRYVELYATSPSGKTLFVCRFCGRTTPTPDKECPTPPSVVSWKQVLPCIVLEEIADAMTEMAEELQSEGENLKSKTEYHVQLVSPTSAIVSWVHDGGALRRVRNKSININCPEIYALIEKMKAEKDEPLERKRV